MRTYEFRVRGVPKPKGSMRAFVVRGKARLTSGKNAADWQRLVADQLQEFPHPVIDGAVSVSLTFRLPRPASLPKRVVFHTKKPDADKLVRAALDAMTGIIFRDDAQVVGLSASKQYATNEEAIGLTGLITWEDRNGKDPATS